MHSIPLPDLVWILWPASFAALVISGAIVLWGNAERRPGIAAGLLPFAIPLFLTSVIVLLVSGIGALLLILGKEPAVPVALVIALVILGVCTMMAKQSGSSAPATRH